MMALRKAGWSMKKIADELGISDSCVYNHLKRMEEEEAVKRIAGSRKADEATEEFGMAGAVEG